MKPEMKEQENEKRMSSIRKELSLDEAEKVAAGANHVQAFSDFFAWIGCGFNHHYAPTGRTKHGHDFIFEATFYEVKCNDCGHITWKRMWNNEAYVQGPKIDPNIKSGEKQ